MHRHLRLLFLVLLASHTHASLPDDVRSLLEFKKGIDRDPSGLVSGTWSSAGNGGCPTWHGVSCDGSGDGAVTGISLAGLGLSGEVKFSTLVGMRSLRNLSLAGNDFTGRLVPMIGAMSGLERLDLSGNRFYGRVPERMAQLWGLSYLNLSFNRFDGSFPAGIGNLPQLRSLDLQGNGFWGDIGSMLLEMRNVEYVDFSGNSFFGDLWMASSKNLSSLGNTVRYLNFSNNKLSGGFFSSESMGILQSLEVLDVSNNKLGGKLPEFGNTTNLRILRVANNELRGTLPEELLGSSTPLTELDLSGNGFTGPVVAFNSTTLKVLNLSRNDFSGALPSSVGTCIQLDLSNNRFSGNLSAMQSWNRLLEVIDLSSNELSGDLPNLSSQFEALLSVKMSNNSIGGTLQFESHPRLSVVDISLNELSGVIPPGLFTSLNLTYLNLSRNYLTGDIPIHNSHSLESLVLPNYPHMEYLDLSGNSLSGTLPPDIISLQMLKLLDVRKNSLSGRIPAEITKLKHLEVLDLSTNHFDGNIPDISQSSLRIFNVAYNDLVGVIPEGLSRFPDSSFHPGNELLVYTYAPPGSSSSSTVVNGADERHHSTSRAQIAIIVGCIGSVIVLFFIFMAVYRIRTQKLCGRNGFGGYITGKDFKISNCSLSFCYPRKDEQMPALRNLSNDHLLNSGAGAISARERSAGKSVEHGFSSNVVATSEPTKNSLSVNTVPTTGVLSSPGSPLSASLHNIESALPEKSMVLNVYSPDRLVGELYFLDRSLIFTAEDLSRAPAEVLGRSSHGTSYKATLDDGHMLTVKWLRVGLVKLKKEFAKEMKRIGTIKHPNIVSLRAYYWGPKPQERLIVYDYVTGDSLALHLYESTPRRYSRLTFSQRVRIAIDVARCLCYLHQEKGQPHGNLKPTNILISGPDLPAQLTDYGLHHFMTPSGTAEQMLNLGALGYRAPELATAVKPLPSFKADVYAFGVIMLELLTKRSAGDIITGQSGAVDLTDWVRMYVREGRGSECFDRDISELDEPPRGMDELLAISLRCILPVHERPNIRTVFEELCSISV